MVYLNRIYTRTGDSGETSLGDGTRVPKSDLRITAYGGVDELNASLGVLLANSELPNEIQNRILTIQNDLFDVGADLCVPESETPLDYTPLRIQQSQVDQLESWIDETNAELSPLNSFILPGGTPAAAFLHQSRTICRRAEIGVQILSQRDQINSLALIYLNRLSDLLFVMARSANDHGESDILWKPGGNRSS